MRFRLRVPRPEHEGSDPVEQEEWKKKIPDEVEKIREEYPDCEVEAWSMDEHRIGLQPVKAPRMGG